MPLTTHRRYEIIAELDEPAFLKACREGSFAFKTIEGGRFVIRAAESIKGPYDSGTAGHYFMDARLRGNHYFVELYYCTDTRRGVVHINFNRVVEKAQIAA